MDYVYEELRKINGLELLDMPLMDRTKLVFSFYNLGISGYELDGLLREKGIFCELSDSRFVMAMTGIGSERSDYEILISALRKIADEKACEDLDMCVKPKKDNKALMKELYRHEKIFDVPTESEWLKPSECEGRISVRAVIPYPPGIPIIVPGERIDARKLNVIERLLKDGVSMIGLNEDDKILCGR